MDLQGIKTYIVKRFNQELNSGLYYHNLEHTLDVHASVCRICDMEQIDPFYRNCLEAAALFHDSGMMVTYAKHEEASVRIASEVLGSFGFSDAAIDLVSSLIMVTKLPQFPSTFYEQILCDADLDYLGREDYLIHAFKLRLEWQVQNIRITTLKEWFDIQIQFLGSHHYFTNSAIKTRKDRKQFNLEEIKQLLRNS